MKINLRSATFVLTAALAALVTAPALAQDMADPVDPIEDKALQEESEARFEQALKTFQQAFDTAVGQATGGKRAKNLARAEVLLEKIDALSEGITKQRTSEAFLAGYDAEQLGPVLKGYVDWHRAWYLLAAGDTAGAEGLASGLGLVNDWWVIGPFDNERGRGFRQAQDVEKEINLDAELEGKERKVRWRQVPVKHRLGFVNLDAMLRPNDQALAYAVAFVKSESEQVGALRLGSDEAVKVWWNGAEVLSKDLRRKIAFDQDVVGVKLAAGWNMLLMKVHDQKGPWGFRMRLTAADGSALSGVTFAADRAQADEAIANASEAQPAESEIAGGARAYYEGTSIESSGTARELFHLGLLHARRGFESTADRKDAEYLKKAAELEPENAIYRYHYSQSAAPPVEIAAEKEENQQRQAREKTLALEPGYALAYRALAGYYTGSLLNLERAEGLLRKALEINDDFLEARLDLARVLERRGLTAAADMERKKVMEDPRAKQLERTARFSASQLQRRKRASEASDAWKAVLTLDARGNDVRRRVAELALQTLGRDEALAVLGTIAAHNPFDLSSRKRIAEILEGAADLDGAIAELQGALRIAPEDEGLLQSLGRVQLKKGDQEGALATYREALRVNPKLAPLERYVEFLDPAAAPYEDEYEIDATALIEESKQYANDENDGWITLLDQIVTKVNRDGTSSSYTRQVARILTNEGVQRFDRYFTQSWGGQAFKWKSAKVTKPDGTVVDAKTTARGRFRMADFPPLQAGDVIDVSYRVDDRQQSFFGDYFGTQFNFADQVPMKHSTFTLITPTDREFYVNQKRLNITPEDRVSEDGTQRIRTWTRIDCEKIKFEASMPDMRELAPQIEVSSFKDWDAFAVWYWSLIRDQHIAADEIKEKVAELIEGKETQMDKVRALYDFVTGDITYQAWPLGVHGYKPYTATAIFNKREGDCKDKSILFNTMLKEIGVDAYPVLIRGENARSAEDFTLPMINHFNHCISYVPDADGNGTAMWMDGTANYHSAFLPPGMDRGAKVLVVKPDGGEILTIPTGTPADTGVDQDWTVTLNEDRSATLEGEITFRGDIAVQIRQVFSVEGQRPMILQGIFSRSFGRVKIVKHDFDDLKDLSTIRASFRVTLEVAEFAKEDGEQVTVPTTFFDILGDISQIAARPEREHDLVINNPMSMVTTAKYVLPEGWEVDAAPESTTIEVEGGAYIATAEANGSELSLSRRFELREPRIRKDVYAEFRDGLNRATSAAQQDWSLKRGGEPSGE